MAEKLDLWQMKWIAKAVVQKAISFLPFKHHVNYLFQKHITKGVLLTDSYFNAKFEHFKSHIKYFQKYSKQSFPETVLELGTGWYPIIPLSFFLLGSKVIYTVDISSLLKPEHLLATIKMFLAYIDKNPTNEFDKNRIQVLEDIVSKEQLHSLDELLSLLHITYEVRDASDLPMKDNAIDFIVSNNTFEHIHEQALVGILSEFNRIKKKDGLMSHFIDMSDHFAHFDSKITIFNFLKFSGFSWKLIDNSVQPQNRLRIVEFRKMYADLEIEIILEENNVGRESDIESITLSKKYQTMDQSDVLVSHSYLISK